MSASQQSAQYMPPRAGQVLAITTSATARSYDISKLAMGGYSPSGVAHPQEVDLYMQAESNDIWFYFATASDTNISVSGADADGASPLTFGASYAIRLVKDALPIRVRIRRGTDKFLTVRGAAGGILRMWAASASE